MNYVRSLLLKALIPCCLLPLFVQPAGAQTVQIRINLSNNRIPVSPYIYGRNNSLSDNPASPVIAANWQLYKDAGLNFFRENGGNDLTKYNWRLKLDSHPDWYNNVYASDWDYSALSLQQNMPWAQGMWGFQLIGQTAKTTSANFNDYAYNQSQWWSGVEQNLAGGGIVNPAGGSQALKNGDTTLYLESWPADSTTALITHWFGAGGLGLDSTKTRYWNMDNEVEIWSSTHDDVMPVQPTAEAFLQTYFAVAKKARALFPGIKLTGPVSPNEWQWFNWNNATVTGTDGKQYPWLEYFIKRVSEEEQQSGVRLLDVLDLHFYPGSASAANVVQYHRVFFDSTYAYPEANGVKNISGSWDNSIQIEDIFGRCQNWLNQYMGPGNGVTLAVSEAGTQLKNDPNSLAVWYASTMGEFMKHGVEYFAPWSWDVGMWETLHLFSRYNKNISVQATSSDEQDVSSYATANSSNDSVTVVLVNRSLTQSETVTVNFANGFFSSQPVNSLTLSGLPVGKETFVSHTNNALVAGTVTPKTDSSLQVTLAPLSITSLQIGGMVTAVTDSLLSFAASRTGNDVLLNFAINDVANVSSFAVERSGNGSDFAQIGMVPASAGQAGPTSLMSYDFMDVQPLPNLNYYRLRIIHLNGTYTYSKIITIQSDGGSFVSIYPNPAYNVVYAQCKMPAGPFLLEVIDMSGKTVQSSNMQSLGSTISTAVDIRGLARGMYFIRAGNKVLKFLKQ